MIASCRSRVSPPTSPRRSISTAMTIGASGLRSSCASMARNSSLRRSVVAQLGVQPRRFGARRLERRGQRLCPACDLEGVGGLRRIDQRLLFGTQQRAQHRQQLLDACEFVVRGCAADQHREQRFVTQADRRPFAAPRQFDAPGVPTRLRAAAQEAAPGGAAVDRRPEAGRRDRHPQLRVVDQQQHLLDAEPLADRRGHRLPVGRAAPAQQQIEQPAVHAVATRAGRRPPRCSCESLRTGLRHARSVHRCCSRRTPPGGAGRRRP